jgi:hypothetical protein
MNYAENYYSFITYIKQLKRKKNNGVYYEEHHIIPKSLGGDNHKSNLILLTPREHFLAHYLLYKATYKKPLIDAFYAMCKDKKYNVWSLKIYSNLLEEYLKIRYYHFSQKEYNELREELLQLFILHHKNL